MSLSDYTHLSNGLDKPTQQQGNMGGVESKCV